MLIANKMTPLIVLGALLCVPVAPQSLFDQSSSGFPSLGSSLGSQFSSGPQLAPASAFFPGQALSINIGGNQPPFAPISFQPRQQPSQFGQPTQFPQKKDSMDDGKHTYPDGTTGDDYPAHKAAKEAEKAKASGQTHTYPDGTTGGDYPAHMAAKKKQHTYPDGTTGGDYPSHMAAKQQGHQYPSGEFGDNYPAHLAAQQAARQFNSQRQGQQAFQGNVPRGLPPRPPGDTFQQQQIPNSQFGGSFPAQVALQQTGRGLPSSPLPQPKHTYPDGSTGGDYPSHLKAQQLQGQGQVGAQHTYPDGTTGGDYPSHLKAQQLQGQGQVGTQHTYPDGTTGGDYPSHLKAQQLQGQGQVQLHAYPDGTTGGDYPSHLKAQQLQGQGQGQQFFPGGTGKQQQIPDSRFGGNFQAQLIAQQTGRGLPGSPLPQPKHTYPDGTTGGDYPSHLKAQQLQGQGQGQGHTYPDGTTGGDYPAHLKAQQAASQGQLTLPAVSGSSTTPTNFRNNQLFSSSRPRIASQSAPVASFALGGQAAPRNALDLSRTSPRGGGSFFQPPVGLGAGRQCFKYTDLAASYDLSDTISNYPMDAIMSELRSRPHIAPMVGYERLPQAKNTSPFSGFDTNSLSLRTLGFQNDADQILPLSNVKYFPANFDQNTLGQSLDPVDVVCPADSFTLRAVTVDNNRCSVVNADYQAIVYTKCKRRECNLCGVGQGVNACVDRYNWVSVMVYCPHWQRGQRIKAVKLHLPQGCTCNRYQC